MTIEIRRLEDEHPKETEFLEALRRIVAGEPRQPRTADLQRAGLLRVCQDHVAWEAGRGSRTPISGDGARWPRVRDEIERVRRALHAVSRDEPEPAERDARHESARLRAELAQLRADMRIVIGERDVALSRSAALLLLLQEERKRRAAPASTDAERLAARRAAEDRIAIDLDPAT